MKKISFGGYVIEIRKSNKSVEGTTDDVLLQDNPDEDIDIEETEDEEESPIEENDLKEIKPIEIHSTNSGQSDEQISSEQEDCKDYSFEKLLSKNIDIIKYYDQLASQAPTEETKTLLNDVCRKLIDNLILSGCDPIIEPQGLFDMTRHKTVPFQMVSDGTPYSNLIRPGIEYKGEVKILAIVEL